MSYLLWEWVFGGSGYRVVGVVLGVSCAVSVFG